MSKVAPAAAANCAIGKSSMRPHTALPVVMDAKMTVKNITSPRARTRSGAAWADAWRFPMTAGDEAPAITLAHTATTGARLNPKQNEREGCA
jgi:hypothetical protein